MKKQLSFFQHLRSKLTPKPSSEFDRQFWEKHAHEFPEREKKRYSFRMGVPVALTAAVALFVGFGIQRIVHRDQQDIAELGEVLADPELIQDYELFAELSSDEFLRLNWEEPWEERL